MSRHSKGRTLELFFIDGNPDGMLTAEVFNWTGHVLISPRTQISEALKRKEANFTGVYILLGENNSEDYAYIGEGEDISDRIRNHVANKDWWTSVVLIVSSANNLNKAHVKYLESRLVEIARSIGRVKLENGNTPPRPSLTEASLANMEAFLEYILLVLPALRIDAFLERTRSPAKSLDAEQTGATEKVEFEILQKAENIYANAILSNGEFIVQKGSQARKNWVGDRAHKTSYWKLYDELVSQNVIVENGNSRLFSQNYAFSSPSAAGAIVNGRSTNGQTAWKLKGTNKTYKDWEIEQVKLV